MEDQQDFIHLKYTLAVIQASSFPPSNLQALEPHWELVGVTSKELAMPQSHMPL